MAPPTEEREANLTDPAFFASQSQKLNALLGTVVREASTATNPDAAIDFMQLTEIVTSLLEEAQMFSVLSQEELGRREGDVRGFMGRIETVHSVIEDWDARTTKGEGKGSCDGEGSRKRARPTSSSSGSGPYDTRSNRRRMQCETEQALNMAPTFDGPYAEMIPFEQYPEREREKAAWWTEPYYD
ncbi:hypothetical protein M409DRAFT_25911 [Zasmidium cellare ATCC 36951]|uniref:Uncharacterized protein n=1 Tax=Zasmidium cellare ATCC 36951 TaxID=1080233 RepID=A0A6A6C9M3_ZASCE|nr:uncharacterized protein M409DRAFT_25911 [Zasmidium cellare ATCC 36951]KAF2163725.1 hypothetical protein M409DRAFT_25911 [Zasmidium cellare ATCC 36951]